MGISDIITNRKCVRAYLDRPVTTEDLEGIISAGRWAPNHGDYRLSVIQDPVLKQRLNDTAHKGMLESGIEFLQQRAALPGYQPLYGAPVLILLSGPADDPYSGINCALAAENMLLEATARGLASCFIVTPYFALAVDPSLAEAACIPEDYAFQCAVLAGHGAAEDPFSNPDRQPRGTVSYC